MYPTEEGAASKVAKEPTQSEQFFSRIEEKLGHLQSILTPFLGQLDSPKGETPPPTSIFLAELEKIEDKITYLLDHLKI